MPHGAACLPPFVELAFTAINGARPERAIAFLPGILGRGINLRTIARRFVEARPGWTAWLVDLRGHGQSPKGTPAPSIEAAARDVAELARRADFPMGAVVGHSFGGKVALEFGRLAALESLAESLNDIVVIDSAPGSRISFRGGDSALAVIDAIESLPRAFASKLSLFGRLLRRARRECWPSLSRDRWKERTMECALLLISPGFARCFLTTSLAISGQSSSIHRALCAFI